MPPLCLFFGDNMKIVVIEFRHATQYKVTTKDKDTTEIIEQLKSYLSVPLKEIDYNVWGYNVSSIGEVFSGGVLVKIIDNIEEL